LSSKPCGGNAQLKFEREHKVAMGRVCCVKGRWNGSYRRNIATIGLDQDEVRVLSDAGTVMKYCREDTCESSILYSKER
jgi:hypothetical protein